MASDNSPNGHIPIGGLTPGLSVDSIYHLVSLEQRTKKNGDPYFMLTLGDATGILNGVIWDNHAALVNGSVSKDDFVRVGGDVGEYNNNLQMTVKRIARVEDSAVDLRAFLPVSPRDPAGMEKELDEWVARVRDKDCRRLLDRLFNHKRLRELYCDCPAAARIHQAYIHGLLEHTLNVMKLADSIANVYEPINRDLLITGTLIHDIGKIRELSWKRTITYTPEGRLLGHIPMGASMIDAIINELKRAEGFDEGTQTQLLHLILSHHGKREWGSPILPQTREALVLHYADHTEAYMTVFHNETARARAKGELWTNFNKMFESYLYAGKAPEGAPPPTETPAPMAATAASGPMDDIYPLL